VVYTGKTAKIAEDGGGHLEDLNVPLVVSGIRDVVGHRLPALWLVAMVMPRPGSLQDTATATPCAPAPRRPGADEHPFGAFTKLANQFAAMPSVHIAWSSWCAVVLLTHAPYLWVRILGALYPVCTLFCHSRHGEPWGSRRRGWRADSGNCRVASARSDGAAHHRDIRVPAVTPAQRGHPALVDAPPGIHDDDALVGPIDLVDRSPAFSASFAC
jgi:hypothetical protein